MSNGNIYSFGIPINQSNVSSSAAHYQWSDSNGLTTPMKSKMDIILDTAAAMKYMILNDGIPGVYIDQELPKRLDAPNLTHRIFKVGITEELLKNIRDDQDKKFANEFIAQNLIGKLKDMQESTGFDVYFVDLGMQTTPDSKIEILVEVIIIGDITNNYDIYIDPLTGDAQFPHRGDGKHENTRSSLTLLR